MFTDDDKLQDEDFDAYTASIKELATQIIQVSPNLPTEAFYFKEYRKSFIPHKFCKQ
jgi:hypothetical protein